MIELFLRLVLGRELTWDELDANFVVLRDALDAKTDTGHEHGIENVYGLQNALAGKINNIEKAAPNGVATLNNEGHVPVSQLPNFTVQAVPVGGYVWFKGNGNSDMEQLEAGDARMRLDDNGNFLKEKYDGTDWAATSGEG